MWKQKKEKKIKGDYFILCTGGVSYPQTGSEGDGHKIAEKLGHNIKKIKTIFSSPRDKRRVDKRLTRIGIKKM